MTHRRVWELSSGIFFITVCLNCIYGQITNSTAQRKLLLVQAVLRHGDRSPLVVFENDPNPVDVWPEGLGKLTKLGKKQHYALGTFLRTMYKDFITSNPNEVLINCNSVDYVMRSAESHAASLYAPTSEWAFEEDFPWQPIPIRYLPAEKDKYLGLSSHCQRATDLESKTPTAEFLSGFKKYKHLLSNVTRHSGKSIKLSYWSKPGTDSELRYWMKLTMMCEALLIEMDYNLTVPLWVENHSEELKEFIEFMTNSWLKSSEFRRLRGGPLLGQIIENMNKKVAGETPDLKVQMNFGHDATVQSLMMSLGVFNMKRPPYCATLIFELYDMSPGQPSVRLLYLNSTEPEKGHQVPHLLILDGCSEFCPMEYFVNHVKDFVPDDWEKECEVDDSTYLGMGWLISWLVYPRPNLAL